MPSSTLEESKFILNIFLVQENVYTDIIPIAIKLLDIDSEPVRVNALWILSNISGEHGFSAKFWESGIIPRLTKMIQDQSISEERWKVISWLLLNLVREEEGYDIEKVCNVFLYNNFRLARSSLC